MSMKSKFLTSVAAIALTATAAAAQDQGQTLETEGQIETGQQVASTETDAYAPGWNADLDQRYAPIADQQIAELIGMNVVTEAGDDVGEVDNFVLIEDRLRAVIGVGGFLGMGEHEVALPLDELTYDGEKLVISYTKEELEAMPEYTEELEQVRLAEADTFRTRSAEPAGEAEAEMTADMEGEGESDPEILADNGGQGGETQNNADNIDISTADGATGGDMSAEGDGSAELAGTQTPDAEDNVDIDAVQTAEADNMDVVEEGGEEQSGEMAMTTEDDADEAGAPTGEEVAAAEEANEAAGGDGDTMTEEVAEAEKGEIEQEAEEMAAEAGQALEEGEQAVERTADAYAPGWNEDLDQRYGDIADRQIAELIGMNVVSDQGEDVGEVDNFVLMEDELRAVVGVGGFLGMGEHEVALPLSELTYDGDQLVIAYTKEELEAMPEYHEELEAVALGETDTFRTRGSAEMETEMASTEDADEAAAPTGEEVAAAEEANEAAGGDGDTMTEEVAEAEKGEIEQEAEEMAAEAGQALEEGEQAVETAAADAGAAVDAATAEVEEGAEDLAQATGEAAAEVEAEAEQMADAASKEMGEWVRMLDAEFAEISDMTIGDLEGTDVVTASGEEVGEIDDFGLKDGNAVAIVGVGGFLGLGEHDVAIELAKLGWQDGKFVIDMTEDELKAMPEANAEDIEMLEGDMTLRASAAN